MAITIKPDGSIVASTAQEAVEIQQEILARLAGRRGTQGRPAKSTVSSETDRVIERLKEFDGQEIESSNLCRVLGVDSPKGIGVKLRHLEKLFRPRGIDLGQVLMSSRGSGKGPKRWAVRMPKQNGSLL